MVRFFCVVGPPGLPIADTGHAFLRALHDQQVKTRALPIGAGGLLGYRRWSELGAMFTEPMARPYVNIVCANANTPMGQRTPAATFATSEDLPPELRKLLGPMADSKSADVDYEPQTVFAGLYTAGVMNVAIVNGHADEQELFVLRRYDLVIATESSEWDYMNGRGVVARYIPPPGLVAIGWPKCRFVRILEEVTGCELSTTATTAPPADTDARRATTSPPSYASRKPSSRLPALARGPSPRRIATDTLTISPRRSRWLRVLAMLLSFMRSLAFWRR